MLYGIGYWFYGLSVLTDFKLTDKDENLNSIFKVHLYNFNVYGQQFSKYLLNQQNIRRKRTRI